MIQSGFFKSPLRGKMQKWINENPLASDFLRNDDRNAEQFTRVAAAFDAYAEQLSEEEKKELVAIGVLTPDYKLINTPENHTLLIRIRDEKND